MAMPTIPTANGEAKQVPANQNKLQNAVKNKLKTFAMCNYKFCFSYQVVTPVPQENNAVPPPAVEEQPKEDGEEFEDLAAVLQHLGLSEYKSTFDEEKIDIESFVRTQPSFAYFTGCYKMSPDAF